MTGKIRAVLAGFLGLVICGGIFFVQYQIPDELHIREGQEKEQLEEVSFGSFVQEEVVAADSQRDSNIPKGDVKIQCKLFGVLPIKEVNVAVVEGKTVTPCGVPIGIYMETRGILVVGTGVVNGTDGLDYEPALNIVQSGDYIVSVDGKPVSGKEDLMQKVNESGGTEIVLEVLRNGEKTKLKLEPVKSSSSEYKIGLWVRDDTQGIGTLTYVDEDGNFGALGHGINDVDTSTLLSIQDGTLYQADILSITKGERGVPGELSGMIHYQESGKLGTINENTECGIFGKLNRLPDGYQVGSPVEMAFKQEVESGPATILCAVDGQMKEYDVEIEKINLGSKDVNKSMVIHVTDENLLALTGGIVQGMSGSPILQHGKLIGAVTHVFIQDATSGYGIFAENMICVE